VSGSAPGLVLSAGYVLVFVYGGRRVIADTLTLGTFIAFMAYYLRLFQPVQALMGLYSSLATVRVSLARVHELLDTPPDVVEAPDPQRLSRVVGAIEFERVGVDLGRGQILRALSFTVAPGETVALVGPSGSGKSTIADLLVRLLDPDEGAVRLDGVDLRLVSLEDLRRHVVLVDQEPLLLHATIEENIRYARPEATDGDVRQSASAAGVDEITARLPDGLRTIVGERGAALSVGERQRVAIARALSIYPPILLADEPTGNLDTQTGREILSLVHDLHARLGSTIVIVTHDMQVAERCSRTVSLRDGRIEQDVRR
jgi:ATP-binding cassette subfamily B protein